MKIRKAYENIKISSDNSGNANGSESNAIPPGSPTRSRSPLLVNQGISGEFAIMNSTNIPEAAHFLRHIPRFGPVLRSLNY
jgi:hypothetical protein